MRQLLLLMLVLCVGGLGIEAQSLNGNDILNQASQTSVITSQGSRISRIEFDITDRNDITVPRSFAFLSKREPEFPERLLVYFLEPELERGTIFLSVDSNVEGENARIWLFLSALGLTKELVSDSDRDAGFAGSNLTNEQLANGFDFSGDYNGELLGEQSIELNWLGQRLARTAFRVSLVARESSQVDFPAGVVWIDTETFVVLRAELENAAGDLQQITRLDDFVMFQGQFEPNTIVVNDTLASSQTNIRFAQRIQTESLPDEIFDVDTLPEFNPADFGIE